MAKYNVIVPSDIKPYPEPHEISAAAILAEYFKTDVLFIRRIVNAKSADVLINGIVYEIKSPTGKGKRNIQHTLSDALKQSKNIVFDARRSKLHMNKITSELHRQYQMTASLQRLLLIRKTESSLSSFDKPANIVCTESPAALDNAGVGFLYLLVSVIRWVGCRILGTPPAGGDLSGAN